jgi:Arc/MetJ family transcription regulator
MTAPLLARMDPSTLRELGHALIARAMAAEEVDPRRKAYCNLTPEGVERFADILASGSRPTVGAFVRYRVREQ